MVVRGTGGIGGEEPVERGEIPADTDIPSGVARLVGPLFYRRWFSREPVDDAFLDEVVRGVVSPLQPPAVSG